MEKRKRERELEKDSLEIRVTGAEWGGWASLGGFGLFLGGNFEQALYLAADGIVHLTEAALVVVAAAFLLTKQLVILDYCLRQMFA